MRIRFAIAAAALAAVPALAQPPRAPRETVTASTAGGKKVVIEYGRPPLNGRKIDELLNQLPAHRVWRAGVNQATTFATESDLTIGDKRVPAGTYTMYIHIPASGDWSLILNRDAGNASWPRLDDYDQYIAQEVVRAPMKRVAAAEPMERFLIGMAPFASGSSSITFTWGDTSYTVPVREAAAGGQAAAASQAPAAASRPPRAPRETVTALVGGKKVEIDYGRPRLLSRSLSDLLGKLPPDRIWRAGENQVTTLTTEGDLMIGTTRVPAGKYSVYVFAPESGQWSLVLNRDPGIELIKIFPQAPPAVANALWPRLDGYGKITATEVVRAPMRAAAPGAAVDPFTITLKPAGAGATLGLAWADRGWAIDLQPAK
jgi:DUF2911 family protein